MQIFPITQRAVICIQLGTAKHRRFGGLMQIGFPFFLFEREKESWRINGTGKAPEMGKPRCHVKGEKGFLTSSFCS
ncbi:hypothetical protein CEXT_617191 [Caerostris extrusa]|uniref:Uncharacterized protein n=1 Tax=Caerostris extrusa TaxID=172846 RepID=A0AAV4XRM2_CAEEX|nr:hypothetical protein CEXT_617191 [Caerostris extrusa]